MHGNRNPAGGLRLAAGGPAPSQREWPASDAPLSADGVASGARTPTAAHGPIDRPHADGRRVARDTSARLMARPGRRARAASRRTA